MSELDSAFAAQARYRLIVEPLGDPDLFDMPQPLYLAAAYPAETWKLMYPDEATRPAIPAKA